MICTWNDNVVDVHIKVKTATLYDMHIKYWCVHELMISYGVHLRWWCHVMWGAHKFVWSSNFNEVWSRKLPRIVYMTTKVAFVIFQLCFLFEN